MFEREPLTLRLQVPLDSDTDYHLHFLVHDLNLLRGISVDIVQS